MTHVLLHLSLVPLFNTCMFVHLLFQFSRFLYCIILYIYIYIYYIYYIYDIYIIYIYIYYIVYYIILCLCSIVSRSSVVCIQFFGITKIERNEKRS